MRKDQEVSFQRALELLGEMVKVTAVFTEHTFERDVQARASRDVTLITLTTIFSLHKSLHKFSLMEGAPFACGGLQTVADSLNDVVQEDIAEHMGRHESAVLSILQAPFNEANPASPPLSEIVGGHVGGRWCERLSKKSTFAQLRAQVTKTLQNIPPVVFANAVTKLKMALDEALCFVDKYSVDRTAHPWLECFGKTLNIGLTTRREIQIVQLMVLHQKDKTALKSKMLKERDQAKAEGTLVDMSVCVLTLMEKAEGGRDLGAFKKEETAE